MRVFVSEYLTSGAWPGRLAGSLLAEGRSMLLALVEDVARIDGCRVTTTWDVRLAPFPVTEGAVEVRVVGGPGEELVVFERLAAEADAVLVIAPETGGELARRCQRSESGGAAWQGCSAAAIDLCGDKLRLARHLAEAGIATIETHPATPESVGALRLPAVVKPRDGAGSQATFLVRSREEFAGAMRQFAGAGGGEPVWQPYVGGQSLSVAALVHPGREPEVFPVAAQRLSDDGRFRYLGGQVPVDSAPHAGIAALVRAACARVPGLRGYVGFDVIVPKGPGAVPVLVEINPRLTTSYLGYRRLSGTNLAERWLRGDVRGPIAWGRHRVDFRPDGEVVSAAPAAGGDVW